MTGYGRSEVRRAHLALTVEARSVNHRYLDIALRYPRLYAPLEARMKQRVGAYFTRGRIDLTLLFQESSDDCAGLCRLIMRWRNNTMMPCNAYRCPWASRARSI